jgi:hypothetical protein
MLAYVTEILYGKVKKTDVGIPDICHRVTLILFHYAVC